MTTQEIVNLPAIVPSVTESSLGGWDKSVVDKDVLAWITNVRGAEGNFLSVVFKALQQFQNRNNMPLTAISCLVLGKEFKGFKLAGAQGESLKQFREPLKRILDVCLVGSTLTFKDGVAKWKVTSNGGVNVDGLKKLESAVHDKLSYKGKKFGEIFPKQKSERALLNEATKNLVESLLEKPQEKLTEAESKVVAKAKEAEEAARVKAVKAFVAKCEEAGWSLDEIIGMMKSKDL